MFCDFKYNLNCVLKITLKWIASAASKAHCGCITIYFKAYSTLGSIYS